MAPPCGTGTRVKHDPVLPWGTHNYINNITVYNGIQQNITYAIQDNYNNVIFSCFQQCKLKC